MSSIVNYHISADIDGQKVEFTSNRHCYSFHFKCSVLDYSFEVRFTASRRVSEMTKYGYYKKKREDQFELWVRVESDKMVVFEKSHRETESKTKEVNKGEGAFPNYFKKTTKTHSRKTF